MYYAFVVDNIVIDCKVAFQQSTLGPYKNIYPDNDLLLLISPTKSEST